jgi:hypothetical protein
MEWRCGPCTRWRPGRPGRRWCGAGRHRAGAVEPAARARRLPTAGPARGRQQRSSWPRILPDQPQRSETTSKRGGQDDVAGTEPLCALNPVSPQTSRCSTGVPVRTLPPVCSTVAAGGPANTSVMAPLKARCAAWAGVAESGQQPERNECESRSGGCGMSHGCNGVRQRLTWCGRTHTALRAAAALSLPPAARKPCQRACGGVADTHEPRSKRSATGSGVGRAPSMARMSSSQEQETPACLARGQAQLSTAQGHPRARARMAGSHAALGIVARK